MKQTFVESVTEKEVEEKLKPGAKVMIGFEPVEKIPHTMLLLIEAMKSLRDDCRYCARGTLC